VIRRATKLPYSGISTDDRIVPPRENKEWKRAMPSG
jgi:hypothetical protein